MGLQRALRVHGFNLSELKLYGKVWRCLIWDFYVKVSAIVKRRPKVSSVFGGNNSRDMDFGGRTAEGVARNSTSGVEQAPPFLIIFLRQ